MPRRTRFDSRLLLCTAIIGTSFGSPTSASGAALEAPPTFVAFWPTQTFVTELAVDANENVYVGALGEANLKKYTSTGTLLTSWGTFGTGDGYFGGAVKGIVVAPSGDIYALDSGNNRIQRFTPAGLFLGKWGGPGSGDGQFNNPEGFAVDGAGNIYVADTGNNRIQKFTGDGVFLMKFGFPGSGPGFLDTPLAIGVDANGAIFVTDMADRVQKFAANGTFVTQWVGTDGDFYDLRGIEVTADGSVYVADHQSSRVQKFTNDGTFLTAWGSYGSSDGDISTPSDVAVHGDRVYVAASGSNRVVIFALESTPVLNTTWGAMKSRYRAERGAAAQDR